MQNVFLAPMIFGSHIPEHDYPSIRPLIGRECPVSESPVVPSWTHLCALVLHEPAGPTETQLHDAISLEEVAYHDGQEKGPIQDYAHVSSSSKVVWKLHFNNSGVPIRLDYIMSSTYSTCILCHLLTVSLIYEIEAYVKEQN